ncbi:Kinase, NEK [Giardia lamblia P15]|uniref:Kinase, NEK n=1 Tax=Giardia intestinalis (strain P15) TaxID=658858 RepID=E1F5J2_GIAIA|nr:Kinase, NEK [Giardia lamblia P15]
MGLRAGQYYDVSLLAEASFGYLYRVKKNGTEGFIALRVADMPEVSPDELMRLAEECRLYFQYQHHKVVQFSEPMIDWASGHIEVEMEYMSGGTLEQYLIGKHGCQIPEVDIWQILGDVTEALAHLHSRINGRAPTPHCDLRPATILRKQNVFKLSFFSLSRFIMRRPNRKSLTDARLYVAPETMRWQTSGPAADVWSLGLIILDLASTLTVRYGSTAHDLSSISLSGYSETLTWLAHACLLVDPTERITAAEIFALLPTQQAARAAIYNAVLASKTPADYLSESLCYTDFFVPPQHYEARSTHQALSPSQILDLPKNNPTLYTDAPEADLNRLTTAYDDTPSSGRQAKLPGTPSSTMSTDSDSDVQEYGNIATSFSCFNTPSSTLHNQKAVVESKIRLLSVSPYEAITTSLASNNPQLLFSLLSHIYTHNILINAAEIFRYQSQHLIEVQEKTPLMWAAHMGAAATVHANLSLVRHVYLGDTALMFAASAGHLECVKLLLSEIGIQKHTSVAVFAHVSGWTALMKAAQNGHTITTELLLLEAGARKADGMTALMLAAQANHYDIVRLLLEREACMQDQDGWTALMYAAREGSLATLRLLLEREKGMIADNGQTALVAAIRAGQKDCIQALFPFEGNLRNSQGDLLYELVLAKMKHAEAVEAKQRMDLVEDTISEAVGHALTMPVN